MNFADCIVKNLVLSSVRTSYKLDCDFISILGWLKIQIPSFKFEIINSIRVHL